MYQASRINKSSDVKGVLKTLAFIGAVIGLYLGLSFLWDQYGRDALTPILGPVAYSVVDPIMNFGSFIIDRIREMFFTYGFLPAIDVIGKISPRFAGILMRTKILFTLVVVFVFLMAVIIIEIMSALLSWCRKSS